MMVDRTLGDLHCPLGLEHAAFEALITTGRTPRSVEVVASVSRTMVVPKWDRYASIPPSFLGTQPP